jgi:hypothetical protein
MARCKKPAGNHVRRPLPNGVIKAPEHKISDSLDGNYDFTVTFLGGVDMAETEVALLTADDFGVETFVAP